MSSSDALPEGIAVDLLFAARPFTGLEHHALHILRGLHAVGASVDVLVPSDVIPDLGDAAEGHRLIPFPRVPRGLRLGREQWSFPWRFGAFPRALPLLHSVLGVAPMLSGVPLVLTVPDLAYRIRPADMHPRARWYFGILGPKSIRRARRVMVSSQAICRQLIDLYHIAPGRVDYVPLCADPIFTPRPAGEIARVRKQFGLPGRYILYVGTIDPRKHIIALDYVPRDVLPAIYSGASVFVYPSRYEGFGLPVLEAMSCGAPVIVSSAEALAELVEDAGVVLRTESIEELTQAMERLLRFDDEQARLRKAGLLRSKAFSIARLGRETAEVYRQALAA